MKQTLVATFTLISPPNTLMDYYEVKFQGFIESKNNISLLSQTFDKKGQTHQKRAAGLFSDFLQGQLCTAFDMK